MATFYICRRQDRLCRPEIHLWWICRCGSATPTLAPDWLRIGTDIVGGAIPPTFGMTFSLAGETIPQAGTPGQPDCSGATISAVADQFGNTDSAASNLGFSSVPALEFWIQDLL